MTWLVTILLGMLPVPAGPQETAAELDIAYAEGGDDRKGERDDREGGHRHSEDTRKFM